MSSLSALLTTIVGYIIVASAVTFNQNMRNWCGFPRLLPAIIAERIPAILLMTVIFLKLTEIVNFLGVDERYGIPIYTLAAILAELAMTKWLSHEGASDGHSKQGPLVRLRIAETKVEIVKFFLAAKNRNNILIAIVNTSSEWVEKRKIKDMNTKLGSNQITEVLVYEIVNTVGLARAIAHAHTNGFR